MYQDECPLVPHLTKSVLLYDFHPRSGRTEKLRYLVVSRLSGKSQRLGKFQGIRKPGVAILLPLIDRVVARIDTRIQVTPFQAQQTLTRDTVPVDVDAVLFWYVFDVKKASLEVTDYKLAVSWAAQTALRDIIGRSILAELLSERATLEQLLQQIIEQRTNAWGVQIQAVEVRDVQIPASLQDAMSREAQAEREKKARVILSEAEKEIAANFVNAAKQYGDNQTAMTLRGWNITGSCGFCGVEA